MSQNSLHHHTESRFDKVPVGSVIITHDPKYGYEDSAILVGRTGEGENREIQLVSRAGSRDAYEWGIYRFQGRWVYGTSADRIQLWSYVDPVGVLDAATE
jgi:hypothetical protein